VVLCLLESYRQTEKSPQDLSGGLFHLLDCYELAAWNTTTACALCGELSLVIFYPTGGFVLT
jgi:hypothetical protein